MNNLIPFDFKGNPVRVVLDENGEPWFIASDVCAALDLGNVTKALLRLDDDEATLISIQARTPTGGEVEQQVNAVNESGLYSLILGSRKPEAKPFKKWVTSEVLPSIRKTGGYSLSQSFQLPKTFPEALRLAAAMMEERDEAIRTKAEIGSRREATAMNTASQATKRANQLEVELDRSKQYCTVKRMEMLQHGQKFSWRLLKSTGIAMGVEPIDVFDANYGTVKAYHADVWKEAYAIDLDEAAGGES
jgi:prophage antirepressor-like protein